MAADDEMPDSPRHREFLRALGAELRQARLAHEWSRAEVVRRMPRPISANSYTGYENFTRQAPMTRLMDICQALGEDMPQLLLRVMRRLNDPDADPGAAGQLSRLRERLDELELQLGAMDSDLRAVRQNLDNLQRGAATEQPPGQLGPEG